MTTSGIPNAAGKFTVYEYVGIGTPSADVDAPGSGQTIEIGAEIVGLFDGEQRAKFVEVDMSTHGQMFASAGSWHKGRAFGVVQMVWPDRNGFLPGEAGFDQRLRFTQPLLG